MISLITAINNQVLHEKAHGLLMDLYGGNASFRDGQYEAIEATFTNRRTLVVQRTGWGKSLVYFVCTKLLREQGSGVTLVVSPLLVLMQNQLEAAEKMGLKCEVLNSSVKDRRGEIIDALEANDLDLLLITPETLMGQEFQSHLRNIRIGLFVIDEAHCISDWGHDFRLEYSELNKVIALLPPNVPVLATTATANDRVVDDLRNQLGGDVYISRGPLSRDSLSVQVLNIPSRIERYAWVLENINKLPGSGIIYCLTKRDCENLSDFLNQNGISAEAYYSRNNDEELINREIEERFKNNEFKVIVATVKLGMGYDKGDISFVIHFQMPSNIVSYYQQIGRAGRNIDRAYTFLLCGQEDEEILNYFINTAFPTKYETDSLMAFIASNDGVSENAIIAKFNVRKNRLIKALTFLRHDGFVIKDGTKYYASPKPYYYNSNHYNEITRRRVEEMEQLKALTKTTGCYLKYMVNCLDDWSAVNCGHCSNCLGTDILPRKASEWSLIKAQEYFERLQLVIEPRKKWAQTSTLRQTNITLINQPGICLSKYGDAGYGSYVKEDKYSPEKRFRDELVQKSVKVLERLVADKHITHVCFVPSLRSDIVKDFSRRLADALGIALAEVLIKKDSRQQKEMENSSFQCENAYNSFFVADNAVMPEKVLLVDDVVDSRWTLTVCGYRLMEAGCCEVYPYALADSSYQEG